MKVNRRVAHILTASGMVSAYGAIRRRLLGSQTAVLMYHRVNVSGDSWSLSALDTNAFDRQLAYYTRNYEIIPLEQPTRTLTALPDFCLGPLSPQAEPDLLRLQDQWFAQPGDSDAIFGYYDPN